MTDPLPSPGDGEQLFQERRPLVRAWIGFWYNDTTRLLCLVGLPLLPLAGVLALLGIDGVWRERLTLGAYGALFVWMFLDNDYSRLRHIGLDEYRNPLKASEPG